MSAKIKTINIKAFRGIPDLELNLDGRSIVIHGENGTGKSSIVESFEFFFTGKVAHLEGVRGLSLEKHGTHVNYVPDDVIVKTTFDPGNITLSRTFKLRPNPTKLLEKYFNISQNGTFILRRSQILEFIICQPGERFRAIGNLIGIERLDSIELEMMRVRDKLAGKIDAKKDEIYKKHEDINKLLKNYSKELKMEETTAKDLLIIANEILREGGFPKLRSFDEVDEHAEEIQKELKKKLIDDKVKSIIEVKSEIGYIVFNNGIFEKCEKINNNVKDLLKNESKLELSMLDLLETGKNIIKGEELDFCPLCEHEIKRNELLMRIEDRIKTVRGLSKKASFTRRHCESAKDFLTGIVEGIEKIEKKIDRFSEFEEEKDKLLDYGNYLNNVIRQIELAGEFKGKISIEEFYKRSEEINKLKRIVISKCTQIVNKLGLTREEKEALKIVRLIEQARGKAEEIIYINNDLKKYIKQHIVANKVYNNFSNIKKRKIQEIYDYIRDDIRNFYSVLHPNEPHKNVELAVAPEKRASTELTIESFGRESEDPRALTSEGHLDSLGLCIFLAFVKKFNIGCPLIVLDDVVTTIDARHRENICKLLFEEYIDNQLIITTHDGVWYEQLCANQRAFGIEGNFKNFKILNWDKDSGPNIRPYKTRWEIIQGKIDNGDKTGAGNDGRQYLEWLLEEIVYNFLVPVVLKKAGGFNVIDLLLPTKKRLRELLLEGKFKYEIFESFKSLESTRIMGNLLSHNNILAANVSLDEVRRFCDSVHNLHQNFLCPECGNFLTYIQKLKILRCPGRNCKNPFEIKLK